MAELVAYPIIDNWIQDGRYTASKYPYWKGYVMRNGILAAIMDANVDACVASWRTQGKNSTPMAETLDDMVGNGKENFRSIMRNMLWIAKIGGDSYAEIIYEDDDPVDLITLPPDRVTQIVKDGQIKNYEDSTTGEKFKPQEIFHLAYNSYGAQTMGISVVERLEPILLSMEQLIDRGNRLYEFWSKALTIIPTEEDDPGELDKLTARIDRLIRQGQSAWVLPKDQVDTDKITRLGLPEGASLDLSKWFKVLMDYMLMSCRTSENILGIGTQNSEESARMQLAGFRQLIRQDQKFLSDNLRFQFFRQKYPRSTPSIKFSFATESQEETLERVLKQLEALFAWQPTDPQEAQLKKLGSIDRLIELGVIPDE